MKDQFNGNTEKRRPPPHLTGHKVYEIVKDVHVILGKRKKTIKKTEEDDMWKKQSMFWELQYWKDLDVHLSIDVMHTEKNMCESLLRILLNTDGKTRDHGHARADLKKMGIRPEFWLDDFFDISVHFTTHLIKEINLLGLVFLYQMYAYKRFNDILNSFVRN
jgi:hypothetical protein